MKKLFFLTPLVASIFSSSAWSQAMPKLEDFSRSVSLVVQTQSGSGTGVVIGKNGNTYALITAKHVLGGSTRPEDFDVLPISGPFKGKRFSVAKVINVSERHDISILLFEFRDQLPLAPILTLAPDFIRRAEFTPSSNGTEHSQKPRKHYNPGLENLRTYFLSNLNEYRYDNIYHIIGDPIVAGYALPSSSINSYLYRFSPLKIVDKISGNKDGYDLVYLATSTVPGMSGGGVFGARRCPERMDWYQEDNNKNTLTTFGGYYGIVAVHGRSEAYGSSSGRSGASLGVPLDSLADFFKANSSKLGIPHGDQYVKLIKELCAKDRGF